MVPVRVPKVSPYHPIGQNGILRANVVVADPEENGAVKAHIGN